MQLAQANLDIPLAAAKWVWHRSLGLRQHCTKFAPEPGLVAVSGQLRGRLRAGSHDRRQLGPSRSSPRAADEKGGPLWLSFVLVPRGLATFAAPRWCAPGARRGWLSTGVRGAVCAGRTAVMKVLGTDVMKALQAISGFLGRHSIRHSVHG